MDDLGAAHDQNRKIYMLGGGNPARIPEVQAFLRSCLEEALLQPQKFDDLLEVTMHPREMLSLSRQSHHSFITNAAGRWAAKILP